MPSDCAISRETAISFGKYVWIGTEKRGFEIDDFAILSLARLPISPLRLINQFTPNISFVLELTPA